MTIQDKIDDVVYLVESVVKDAAIPEGDKERILGGVKELGFQWQKANAFLRAVTILLGLISEKFPANMIPQFISECVQLQQMNELKRREAAGSAFMFNKIPMPLYVNLVDMLMVEQIEGKAGAYAEKDPDDIDDLEEQEAEPVKSGATVETVEKVPDVKKPAKAQAKKSSAARKTTARKSGGAADGK